MVDPFYTFYTIVMLEHGLGPENTHSRVGCLPKINIISESISLSQLSHSSTEHDFINENIQPGRDDRYPSDADLESRFFFVKISWINGTETERDRKKSEPSDRWSEWEPKQKVMENGGNRKGSMFENINKTDLRTHFSAAK